MVLGLDYYSLKKRAESAAREPESRAFGHTTGATAEAGVGVFAVAADGQRLAIDERQQRRTAAAAQALLHGTPEQADSDAIDTSAEGRRRRQARGSQGGSTPVAALVGPADGPIMQGGPEEDGHQHPGLELDILLSEVLGGLQQQAVQQGPEFAFHGSPPRG
jgi:hypothetical protein